MISMKTCIALPPYSPILSYPQLQEGNGTKVAVIVSQVLQATAGGSSGKEELCRLKNHKIKRGHRASMLGHKDWTLKESAFIS